MLDHFIQRIVLNMKAPSNNRGFTLIEMMIGVSIMAILLAIGLPQFSTWIGNARIRTIAESVLSGLQIARSEAVSRNAIVEFTLTGGSGWRVGCRVASASCPATIQSRPSGEGAYSAVTVTAQDEMPIGFDNLGMMVYPTPASGAAATRIDVDIDSAVMSAGQSKDLRVTISVGGGVRLCDPNVADSSDARSC